MLGPMLGHVTDPTCLDSGKMLLYWVCVSHRKLHPCARVGYCCPLSESICQKPRQTRTTCSLALTRSRRTWCSTPRRSPPLLHRSPPLDTDEVREVHKFVVVREARAVEPTEHRRGPEDKHVRSLFDIGI
jgi:hypothetical protein